MRMYWNRTFHQNDTPCPLAPLLQSLDIGWSCCQPTWVALLVPPHSAGHNLHVLNSIHQFQLLNTTEEEDGTGVQFVPPHNALELRTANILLQSAWSPWEGSTAHWCSVPLFCADMYCCCQALPWNAPLHPQPPNCWCWKRSDSSTETGQQAHVCSSYMSHYSLNETPLSVGLEWLAIITYESLGVWG